MKKQIVVASGNKGKLREIKDMLCDYEVISCSEAGFKGDIEENGNTFYENALIKAKTVAEFLNVPALADDSGICVEALNGEPGIYSARYAGDGIDEHNNELLLSNLKGKENRNAKFVCCMVYYDPKTQEILTADGETKGYILESPSGKNGFGYDPIFHSYDLDMCLGVASEEQKNTISHRYRALKKIKELLER